MPKQYEKYLEYWYSEKWRIPDANFVTAIDSGGVVHKRIRNHKFTHISVETISNFEKYLWE